MPTLPWPHLLKPLLSSCKHKPIISKLHALTILTGATSATPLLITSYASIGDTVTARKVFDQIPHPKTLRAYNAMIVAYSRQHSPSQALVLYSVMISEGRVRPDSSTFTVALKACASTLDLKTGVEIWYEAKRCGYEGDVFVGCGMLNLYAKCGRMDEAVEVFEKMGGKRDVVCCTAMVTGFLKNGRPVEAVEVCRRMKEEGMEFDGVVMMGLVQACASLGEVRLGMSVHGCMVRRGLGDVVAQTSLVDMYAKCGRLELACCVFDKMSCKNAISWGALVSGFAQNGFAAQALEMVVEMQRCGFETDSASLVSSLLACSQVGLLKLGKSIHGFVLRRGLISQVCGTAVIDMYTKSGSLSYARTLFDQLDCRDLISWNAMISCYGIHGCAEEAQSLFQQMTETNIKPDHATFASLLSAFSHSGLVEEGQHWFNIMVNKYKIHPGEKHYACTIDLLARSGRVEDAYELIASMNTKPGLAVWVALLSGCHNHRKFSVGDLAAKKVLELNPDDMGVYTLVSNFYAMAGKWEGVASTQKMMKQTGAKKVPGYSAVEVNGELHAFLIEDKSHQHHEDIMLLLNQLYYDMRAMGYVPKSLLPNFGEAHFSDQRKFIKSL